MQRRNFIKNVAIGSALSTLPLSCGISENNRKSLKDYPDNVRESLNHFEHRRKVLLQNTAGGPNISPEKVTQTNEDLYSNRAMANLLLKRHVDAANQSIIRTANWWDHPHPKGRDHKGENDFTTFQKEILANSYKFDHEKLTLTYNSKQSGQLEMDARGNRLLDGNAVNLDYPSFKNPYMYSEWDSGIIKIQKGGQDLKLDFRSK